MEALDQMRQEHAKRRVQHEAYRLVHMLVIVYACLAFAIAIFATISFQTWVTIVFWGAAAGALAVLVISILDDVYAYTVVFIALVADAGWNVYALIVDGATFYKILYAVFNPGYIPDNCPQPYCEGYRADTFWAYYLLLAAETGLVFCMLYVYYQLFTVESNVSQSREPETFSHVMRYFEEDQKARKRE